MKTLVFREVNMSAGNFARDLDMKRRGREKKERGWEETRKKEKQKAVTPSRLCAFQAKMVKLSPSFLRKSSKSFP